MNTSRLVVATVVAMLVLGLLAFGSTLRPGSSEAQSGSMYNCPAPGKWSMAVWNGQSGTAPGDALAGCGTGAVDAAYALDPQTQAWLRWFANKPELSNLPPLNDMQAVLALGSAGAPATTPTPVSTPTPTPKPAPGTILYQADWSQGPNGWPEAFGWKWLDGNLLHDGSKENTKDWISPPYEPGANVSDYAVEVEAQVARAECFGSFRIIARGGYTAGPETFAGWRWTPCGTLSPVFLIRTVEGEEIASRPFDPATDWHTYRFEVAGNTLRLLIDGVEMFDILDNRYLSGGTVGLWSSEVQLVVRSFKVIAL